MILTLNQGADLEFSNIFMGFHWKNPNKEILVAILVSSLGLQEQFYHVSQSQLAWSVGLVIIWIRE